LETLFFFVVYTAAVVLLGVGTVFFFGNAAFFTGAAFFYCHYLPPLSSKVSCFDNAGFPFDHQQL